MTVPMTESTGSYTALSKETGEELKLAMQRLWLTGKVTPFGARLLVEHSFESAEKGPVEVIYAFMLPQDAALRSFRVVGEGFEVTSDLQPVEKAVETYERGIDDGSLAVLLRQYRDGMVNLTVGNLQPGERVRVILEILAGVERHDAGFRFRFPFTLAPAYHSEMRSVPIPGGGEIELPTERFGDLILPTWKENADALHSVGFDLEIIGGQVLSSVISPSHGISVGGEGVERRVGMAVEAEVPNRDLVIEAKAVEPWQVAWSFEGSTSALLSSTRFGEPADDRPRRVVFVLDRSGSMSGRPIEQAKKAIEAGIAAMRPEDRFSIVAFDHQVESLSRQLLEASDKSRKSARKFLSGISARGGTELASGVSKAASILEEEGGDLLLLTDGQVFDTEVILGVVRKTEVRVHTLGIGSASQDRFLSQIGRETGGQTRFLTARERVDLGLLELFAAVNPAVATDVEVQVGSETLMREDVFPGQPMLVRGEGRGVDLLAVWPQGDLEVPLVEAPVELGRMLSLLDGAARITEIESRIVDEPKGEEAQTLEALSRKYGLASRVMSLVAVVQRESDRAGELPRTQVVPVGMPHDLEMNAYFGTGAIGGSDASLCLASAPMIEQRLAVSDLHIRRLAIGAMSEEQSDIAVSEPPKRRGPLSFFKDRRKAHRMTMQPDFDAFPPPPEDSPDSLMEAASLLEEDGGMPGRSLEERIVVSLGLLEALVDDGSTRARGPFRHHVRRLIEFLGDVLLDDSQRGRLADLVARAES